MSCFRFLGFAIVPVLALACGGIVSNGSTAESEGDPDQGASVSPTAPIHHTQPRADQGLGIVWPRPDVDFLNTGQEAQGTLDSGSVVQHPDATAPLVDSGIPFDSGPPPAWATAGTTTPVTLTIACSRVRPIYSMGSLCPTSWKWGYNCVESDEAESCGGTLANITSSSGTVLRLTVGSCTRNTGAITGCAKPWFSDPSKECGSPSARACATVGSERSDHLWPLDEQTLAGDYTGYISFKNNNGSVGMNFPSFRVPGSTNRSRDGTSCKEANGGMASDGHGFLHLDFANGALRAGPLATATGDWTGGAEGMCTITIE